VRHPGRIHPIIKLLEKYWSEHPDLRLGQIISTMHSYSTGKNTDLFYVEDSVLIGGWIKQLDSLK
jgi:uncharacterized protein YihD (DUF1040 family)